MKLLSKNTFAILGATAGAVALAADPAMAQGIAGFSENIKGQLSAAIDLLVIVLFVVGIFFVATGLLKLKAAADTQGQQVKYGEGIWRLALGAALIAFPYIAQVVSETAGTQSGTVNVGTLNTGL